MNDQVVSRTALLRSLDSLEQICRKRIEDVHLIDDKQLPLLVKSNKEALLKYASHYKIAPLAGIAKSISVPGKYRELPEFIWVTITMIVGMLLLFPYFFVLAIMSFPLVALVILYRSKRNKKRNFSFALLADTISHAKTIVTNN
jgi:hypothetical protein